MKNLSWGDDDDDDVPAPHETEVDASGCVVRSAYKRDEFHRVIRTDTRIRIVTETIRKAATVTARRARLAKFGNAVGVTDDRNVTITDSSEVRLVHPNDAEADDAKQADALGSAFGGFIRKQEMRRIQRGLGGGDTPALSDDDEKTMSAAPSEAIGGRSLGGGGGAVAAGGGGGGVAKYLPPSARVGGAAGGASSGLASSGLAALAEAEGPSTTLRLSNLSEGTKEADLQDLCEHFGAVARAHVAKDQWADGTWSSRGYAFVTFHRRESAEAALAALHGYAYDSLIMHADWAKPAGPHAASAGGAGGLAGGFRSGYGKALAQDTHLAVTYASNRTN
jgi:translation initiation factor 3 subunit G